MIQDYHYLEGFGRAVSIALSQAPDTETLRKLALRVNTPVERPIHVKMFELLEISEADAERVGPSPTNRAYVNHMTTSASTGGVGLSLPNDDFDSLIDTLDNCPLIANTSVPTHSLSR